MILQWPVYFRNRLSVGLTAPLESFNRLQNVRQNLRPCLAHWKSWCFVFDKAPSKLSALTVQPSDIAFLIVKMETELFTWRKAAFLVNFRIELFGSCSNTRVLLECYSRDAGGGEILMCCSFVANMAFILPISAKSFVATREASRGKDSSGRLWLENHYSRSFNSKYLLSMILHVADLLLQIPFPAMGCSSWDLSNP